MDNSRILDDLSRVAGGAFSVLSALGKQVQHNLKDQMGDKFTSSHGLLLSDAHPLVNKYEKQSQPEWNLCKMR